MNNTTIDYHSPTNQRIIEKFVDRDVIMLATSLVEDLIECGKLNYEEFENTYRFDRDDLSGDEEAEYTTLQARLTELNDREDYPTNEEVQRSFQLVKDAIAKFESQHAEEAEISEYWFVTKYLYNKLLAQGECVLDSNYGYIWRRQTTSQSIHLDGVIGKIAEDMEILEGQKYDWSEGVLK